MSNTFPEFPDNSPELIIVPICPWQTFEEDIMPYGDDDIPIKRVSKHSGARKLRKKSRK